MRPPRAAERLLRCAAPRAERQCLLDELAEEFDRLSAQDGPPGARAWYWRQARASLGPLAATRIRRLASRIRTIDVRPASTLEDVGQAVRWIRRNPFVAATVVATLAAATAALFATLAVAERTIVTPLPYPSADRLVSVWTTGPTRPATVRAVSRPDFLDWREHLRSFAVLTAYAPATFRFTDHGDPREIDAVRVEPGFERLMGSAPAAGRFFSADDFVTGGSHVAVLQHAFWKREFGGDPGVVGRTIMLDERPYRVVGVLPETRQPLPLDPNDLWVPLLPRPGAFWETSRGSGWLTAIGRLSPGVSTDAAEQELGALAAALERQHPASNRGKSMGRVAPLADDIRAGAAHVLALLGAALGAVLIVACGNVASLLLSSASARRREFAVRTAIGASGRRLLRQLFLENLILCGGACALGLVCAPAVVQGFTALYQQNAPQALSLTPSLAAAAGAMAVGLALALTLPQLTVASRTRVAGDLRTRATPSRTEAIVRHTLVASQIALSVLLVIAGTGLVRTVERLQAVDPGFAPDHAMTFRVTPSPRQAASGEAAFRFYERVVDEVGRLPGVTAAASAVAVPFTSSGWQFGVKPPDGGPEVLVAVNLASPGYFNAMGIQVREGRALTDLEQRSGQDVAVVNEPLARLIAPAGSAVGVRFPYSGQRWEIVGVVAGARQRQLRTPARPELFIPWHLAGPRPQAIVVRAAGDPLLLMPQLIEVVRVIDPTAPLTDVSTLDRRLDDAMRVETFRAALLAALAILAVGLAALGAYSVTAYASARRTREYVIRMALGEPRASIIARAIAAAAVPALYGLAAGATAAVVAAPWIQPFLYGTEARDAATIAASVSAILAISLLAALASARAAARSSPAGALQAD